MSRGPGQLFGNRVEEAFLGVPTRVERVSVTTTRDSLLDRPLDRSLDGRQDDYVVWIWNDIHLVKIFTR